MQREHYLTMDLLNFQKKKSFQLDIKFLEHETLSVEKGKEDNVAIAVKDPISMVIKTNEKELYKPVFTAEKEKLEAAIEKGTVVGKVHLEKTEGTDYGYIT